MYIAFFVRFPFSDSVQTVCSLLPKCEHLQVLRVCGVCVCVGVCVGGGGGGGRGGGVRERLRYRSARSRDLPSVQAR